MECRLLTIVQAEPFDFDEWRGLATGWSFLQRTPRLYPRCGNRWLHTVTILRCRQYSASHEAIPLIASSKTTNTRAEA